jgi:hypothetical protein
MAGILSPVLRQRFQDSSGNPLAGGKLYSYRAGTAVLQATYTDQTLATPNENPVILDANGEADVWINPGLAYKFVLKNSADIVQFTTDNVIDQNFGEVATWDANHTYQKGSIVRDSSGDGLLYVSLTNGNTGNALTTVANWRSYDGKIRTVSTDTTADVTDNLIRSNTVADQIFITLPPCSTTPFGKKITVKDVGNGTNTTVVRGSGTDQIDGANVYATGLARYDSLTVMNNGTSWDVI